MKRFTLVLTSFLALLCTTITHASVLTINPDSVEAASWIIYDPQSKQTIAEYNSHAQRAPASLTKMMVAYLTLKAIQEGKLKTTDTITASDIVHVVQPDESQMFLRQGQQITVDQLLSGLIVMSANDAAVTLAQKLGGDIPHFVEMMNSEAKALGMTDTHFMNPAGITMDGHYASAADLAKLANTLIQQYPQYLSYSKQTSYSWNGRTHHATNILLKQDPTVDGLKTGYTAAAGYNLALTANRPAMNPDFPERRLIVVVMGTKSAYKRAQVAYELMNMAFNYTRDEVAIKANQMIAQLPVINGKQNVFNLKANQSRIITTSLYDSNIPINMKNFSNTSGLITNNGQTITPSQETKTQLSVQLDQKQLTAPLNQEMNLANIKVFQNNQLIEDFSLSAKVELERASLFERFIHWLKHILPFFSDNATEAIVYPIK